MNTYDKKYDFMQGPFIGGLRATMSFITTLIALLHKLKLFENSFQVWVGFAAVTTLYSWLVDVKGDWGFFDYKNRQILR